MMRTRSLLVSTVRKGPRQMTADSEYKDGACRWCSDEGQVFKDNSLCDNCDGDVVRCEICKHEYHRDDTCRHVFQDRHCEWRGAGMRPVDPDLKAPFFAFLSAMPEGFATDLRTAIRSGRFHTWVVAPMIGGGGLLTLYGMPDRDGKWMPHKWGDEILTLSEGEKADELADGYRWLVSLYDKKTTTANRATVKWISEWLAAPAAQQQ